MLWSCNSPPPLFFFHMSRYIPRVPIYLMGLMHFPVNDGTSELWTLDIRSMSH